MSNDPKHAIIGQLVEQNAIMGAQIHQLQGELKAKIEEIQTFKTKKAEIKAKA